MYLYLHNKVSTYFILEKNNLLCRFEKEKPLPLLIDTIFILHLLKKI